MTGKFGVFILFAVVLLFYFVVFLPTDRYYDKIVAETETSSVSDIITKLDAAGGWIHIYTNDGNELQFSSPKGGYTSMDFKKKSSCRGFYYQVIH